MSRAAFTARRLREVLLDGKWIANTNYKDQIQSVSWRQATRKVGSLNTIALLVFHVNYYLAGLLKAFDTGKLEISDKFSFEMSAITSEEDWELLRNEFLHNTERFVSAVEAMPDSRFDEPFFRAAYGTYWRNIEGVIEHCYYHLGQVSLIRKMVS